jgi:hypothetical protein
MSERDRPRRPTLLGPAALQSLGGGYDPAKAAEVAHATAGAVVEAGRQAQDPDVSARLVGLLDEVGLDTLAELWADRPARSLPGALWRLYALREWVRVDPAGSAADFAAGRHAADVARVVAGAAEPPGPDAIRELLESILGGVFRGDLAVALERAGAFCRVVAAGRAFRADDVPDAELAEGLTRRSASIQRTAEDLEAAAGLWRTHDLV